MPSPAVHTAHRWRKLEERRDVRLASATAVAHGRPDALGSAEMQDTSGALLQAASGSHPGLQPRSDRSDYHGSARMGQRRRRSRRMPAASCGTRASRMLGIRNVQLAGSPAVANRPAEAARCLESCTSTRKRVHHPQYARCGENLLRTQQDHTNTRPMPASGPMGATCSRRAPRSHHIAGLLEVECEG
jgi:hypothetical protein